MYTVMPDSIFHHGDTEIAEVKARQEVVPVTIMTWLHNLLAELPIMNLFAIFVSPVSVCSASPWCYL
jgi:hypothetical protein